jgi:hypothetical protein
MLTAASLAKVARQVGFAYPCGRLRVVGLRVLRRLEGHLATR